MATLETLTSNVFIRTVVSRTASPLSRFQDFYGLSPGGRFEDDIGGANFGWDVYDRTRNIASGRARGTAPVQKTPQTIGTVTGRFYRSAETVPLSYDRIFRMRPLGSPFGVVDTAGESYIARQIRTLGERFRNAREFIVASMFKGGFDILSDGDDWIPVASGAGTIAIDFKHPAGNQGTVGGIFAGDWQTHATAKILKEILDLNAFSEQQSGFPIRHAWVNGVGAYHVLQNAEVINLGGSSNQVFTDFGPTGVVRPDGRQSTDLTFTLRGIPWINWHVYDGGLNVNGSYTKFIPSGKCIFTPDPDPEWLSWGNGSELVKDHDFDPPHEEYGLYGWRTERAMPANVLLHMLDNGIAAPKVPTAWYYATIHA